MEASKMLLDWYDACKRDLPWRHTREPYRIWISEVMLQQTRAETVIGYYARFLERFPCVEALAAAPEEDVLKMWEGLGYYSRALNLQKAAKLIVCQGGFPTARSGWLLLPGVGEYTAGAVASIAFEERVPAVDGNVTRVMSRYYGIRQDITRAKALLYSMTLSGIPADRPGDYNQALMELGATLCAPGTPDCERCPWRASCSACEAGDAAHLPVHEKRRPPLSIDLAVCLLTYRNRVLIMKRSEPMLRGLYVFPLVENETEPERVSVSLAGMGMSAVFTAELGHARHVFTHRCWEMTLLHFALIAPLPLPHLEALNARMAALDDLSALPFPTAMRAARQHAVALLSNFGD